MWFVTRMKNNADFHLTKVLVDKAKRKAAKGVLKEQYITVAVKQGGLVTQRLKLPRIIFKTDGKARNPIKTFIHRGMQMRIINFFVDDHQYFADV